MERQRPEVAAWWGPEREEKLVGIEPLSFRPLRRDHV